MAPAGAEGLVLGRAGDVEAVGVLVDVLVAVRGDVPHQDLVALARSSGRRARCRAWRCGGSGRRPGTSAATPRPAAGSSERSASRAPSGRGSPSARACRSRRSACVESLPAATSRKKPIDDLVLGERLAVDLGVDEHAGQVVGRVLAALGDRARQRSKISGMSRSMIASDALGVDVGIVRAERRVHQPRPGRRRPRAAMPMKLPITRATTGCATSVTRSQRSRPPSCRTRRR